MASNINPTNIDTTYPVAGQDNDSQGFRDNFTNIKNNFAEAEREIDDLQANVILKGEIGGESVDNDFADTVVSGAQIKDFSEVVEEVGTISGTVQLDHTTAHYYTLTTNGNVELDLVTAEFPPAGSKGRIQLEITISDVAHTLTLPSSVSQGTTGIQGLASSIITFAETGTYIYEFTTTDGGATVTINDLTRPRNAFDGPILLASTDDVADAAAISLATAVSTFATSASETATLATGTEGQVKTLIMASDSGDMVVTVEEAGWKASSSGTITFDDRGDTCTLQYINAKWYATASNGVAFG